MKKTTLVIMAAGMGSRFGGCKQITPLDEHGHVIMDYSIYDALLAGFDKIVCVIKPEMEADFRSVIGDRIAKKANIAYAYQTMDRLPEGFSIPEGRIKPWGTAHAVLCAANEIEGDFCAINADDFYGRTAYQAAHDFLVSDHKDNEHAMVGYLVEKTLTENGYVSRGVCETDENGLLKRIVERVHIEPREGGAAYIEDGEEVFIPEGTRVSMNMWAFGNGILSEMKDRFVRFLTDIVPGNPLKAEYFLPSVPDQLICEGKATVRMLHTNDRWHGVTYHDDLEGVQKALAALREAGVYPEKLW